MSIETKSATVEDLRRKLAKAEAALNRAVQARINEPGPGARILIEAQFPSSSQVYTYLALRTENPRAAGANWYVTGQAGKKTWDDILRLVERGDYTVTQLVIDPPW